MMIVLLALDGEPDRALDALRTRYPGAEFRVLPRDEIQKLNAVRRVSALRKLSPDIFAVSTVRLRWQQGQSLLLLFAALAGARVGIILDAEGKIREERRFKTALLSPFRLVREAGLSARAVIRARRELGKLEQALEKGLFQATPAASRRATFTPLRIAYLRTTPAAGAAVGGATSHINGFIHAALGLGAELKLISNDRIAGLDPSRVPERIITPDSGGLTRAAFELNNSLLLTEDACREIANNPPDLIYQRYSRFNWTGVEASRRTGRPLFLEYNGSEVWMGRHWDRAGRFDLLERCEQLNLAAAARIFVVAEVERRNLERAGVEPEKIVVNPNGVDPERFQPNIGGVAAREELGIGLSEILVGFVGTFGPWHGVLALAEAIELIAAKDFEEQIRFLLVGTGSLREQVETMLHEAGLWHRCIFTGAVAHERVPLLLDACDVLVSPHVPLAADTEFFGSPTKLFEYMAMGKAIVASRLGQIKDVLEDENTALLVEPGDASALAEAILRLSRAREVRDQLGAAARAVCVERYTWTHNVQRVLDAYRLLGR